MKAMKKSLFPKKNNDTTDICKVFVESYGCCLNCAKMTHK